MPIKDFSKSTFIFSLIDEFQIFNKSGDPNPLSDKAFELFCNNYKTQSKTRDYSLLNYLNSTTNFFRTFLLESKWTFSVAMDVIWFFDELIISDPIISLINNTRPIQSKKQELLMILKNMFIFKDCIDCGYMLFAGEILISTNKMKYENPAESLLKSEEILNSFEQYTLLLKKPSPINNNPNDNLTQLEAIYEGHLMQVRPMGTYIPPHISNSPEKLSNGIMYDFSSKYECLTKEELISFGKIDMLDGIKQVYKEDISIVLNSLVNSLKINTPSLFFRSIDSLVAQKYSESISNNPNQMITDRMIYDCSLPYLNGVPPQRLFELREQIPTAFEEFRAFLYETIKEARKETTSFPEFKFFVDRKIKGKLDGLKTEVESANRKLKFKGISTLIMLIGALKLNSLWAILGESGAAINMNNAFDAFIDRKEKIILNPIYFLWKAGVKK